MKTKTITLSKEIQIWDGPALPYIDEENETITFSCNEDDDMFLYYSRGVFQTKIDENINTIIETEIRDEAWEPLDNYDGPDIDGALVGFCDDTDGSRICIVSFQIQRVADNLCHKCGKKLGQPGACKRLWIPSSGNYVWVHKQGYCEGA